MLYAGNLGSVADLFVSAPLNTDDRPLIEFLARRLTRVNIRTNTDWFTGEPAASRYQTEVRELVPEVVSSYSSSELPNKRGKTSPGPRRIAQAAGSAPPAT
jgi:hypothetical protein